MSLSSPWFDLRGLYEAIDVERDSRGMSWSGVAREVGVAASTIRRFRDAEDAEADGVLALIRWLGHVPEDYVKHGIVEGKPLRSGGSDYVRVDMELLSRANEKGGSVNLGPTRTTIQILVDVAQRSGRPVEELTRLSQL